MLDIIGKEKNIQKSPVTEIWHNDGDQVLAYSRNNLIFVFNFSYARSYTDYGFMVPQGAYDVILNTDAPAFGGHGLNDDSPVSYTHLDVYKRQRKYRSLQCNALRPWRPAPCPMPIRQGTA